MAKNDTITSYINKYHDDILVPDQDGLTPLDKNYLRVLFKPGRSVQTRELNQLQSTIQAQLDRFGKSIFSTNKPLLGGECVFDKDLLYIDVAVLTTVDTTGTATLEGWLANNDLEDLELNQVSNSLIAKITHYENRGVWLTDQDYTVYRFFIKYKADGAYLNVNLPEFEEGSGGEVINITEFTNSQIQIVNTIIGLNVPCTPISGQRGYAVAAKINPGFYFVKGCAAQVDTQYKAIALSATEELYTGFVVLKISESQISAIEDPTLLDNAAGSQNEGFIGADRYKITLTLDFTTDITSDPNFVQILDITDSRVVREVDSEDNSKALQKIFARRTYEESGDYVLKRLDVELQELYNDGTNDGRYNNLEDLADAGYNSIAESRNSYALTLSPTTAYVKGYRVELPERNTISAPKAKDTYKDLNEGEYYDAAITADLGNYVKVFVTRGLPEFDAFGTTYTLYDDTFDPDGTPTTGRIGTCKIQSIEGLGQRTVSSPGLGGYALGGYDAGVYPEIAIYLHDIQFDPVPDGDPEPRFGDVHYIYAGQAITNNGGYGQPLFTLITPGFLEAADRVKSLYRWPVDVIDEVSNIEVTEKISQIATVEHQPNPNQMTVTFTQLGAGEVYDKSQTNITAVYYDSSENEWHTFTDFEIVGGQPGTDLQLDLEASLTTGQLGALVLPGGPLPVGDPTDLINDEVRVVCSVNRTLTDRGEKTKVSVVNRTVDDMFGGNPSPGGINAGDVLELPDVFHLISMDGTFNNPGDPEEFHWELVHDGQHDTEYKPAQVRALVDNPTLLSYTHWEFDDAGKNYYTRDSYVDTGGSKIPLEDLPYYDNEPLGDFLDLRLRSVSNDRIALDPGSPIEAVVNFYLPRRDILVANTQGYFSVVTGISSPNPSFPPVPDDSIHLVDFTLPAYTFSVKDIQTFVIDNKRFTMRDIGKLEDRIETLEYYTTLSLLEKSAADKSIYDETGLERFKNGFVVDGFRGHDVGNVFDPDYLCSIDRDRGILYPAHPDGSNILLELADKSDIQPNPTTSGGYAYSGESNQMIGLRYNKVEWMYQPYSSQLISVQPHDMVAVNGVMNLLPEEDTWVDYDNRPAITIDPLAAVNDAIRFLAEETGVLGTEWGDWVTTSSSSTSSTSRSTSVSGRWTPWGGRPVRTTTTRTTTVTTLNQQADGVETTLGTSEVDVSLGRYVTEVGIRPYMRSRPVRFRAEGLMPNARYYAFFDDINVTGFCRGTDVRVDPLINSTNLLDVAAGERGRELVDNEAALLARFPQREIISDADGVAQGVFIVPNSRALRFPVGDRIFKITTSPRNIKDEETSFATARFISGGLNATTEERIIGSRVPRFIQTDVQRFRTVTNRSTSSRSSSQYFDPVAQSFRVDEDNGVFITSASAWFGRKPTLGSGTGRMDSVRAYIVTMENGYPTSQIVPGTESSKPSSQVTVSDTGDVETEFVFDHPVYLMPQEEYALVIFSESPDYFIYIADLGDTDLISGQQIGGQADVGVLFTSSNKHTWSAQQNRDMKFRLTRAQFDTNLATVTARCYVPEKVNKLNVTYGGAGHLLSSTTVTIAPPTRTVPDPNNPGGFIQEAIPNGVQAEASAIIDVNTGEITALEITNPGFGYVEVPTVTISHSPALPIGDRATATAELFKKNISSFLLNQKPTIIGGVTRIDNRVHLPYPDAFYDIQPRYIIENLKNTSHYINPQNAADNYVEISLKTDDEYVSPQFDKNTLSLTTRYYTLPSTYITRRITLRNPADQIDGWIAINRPSSAADVKVYIKLYNANGDPIENYHNNYDPWWELNPVEPRIIPTNSERNIFEDIRYSKNFELFGIEYTSFNIKLVLSSTNQVEIPSCKDLRFIATS